MGKMASGNNKLDINGLKKFIEKKQRKTTSKLPAIVTKNFEIDNLVEKGYPCYRLRPKNFNGTYIIYIYGGMMYNPIMAEQWEFISKLSMQTGVGLFVPMYPLAPEHCCREVFDVLLSAYASFTKGMDVERVIMMGDSSGAGLALSIAMLAWKEGIRKPDQLILLSPILDTEFFDKKLEEQVLANSHKDKNYFYNETLKDFWNTFWVKDYAIKTEYTSPYYEDYTDVCDDMVLFSGEEDMYNCYARAFYKKAKQQGVNIRFFEFEDELHNFILHSKSDESRNAYRYLCDVINKRYDNSLVDLYPVKKMADWTKKIPEVITDEWAVKFMYDNKFDFSGIPTKMNQYRNIVQASRFAACDAKVKQYILKFPNCTIVHLGCRLDNMFSRVDNGRIQWYSIDVHNIMSVRRSMYGVRKREKTVGRSLMDFSWIEDINCKKNQGIMFVCNDSLTYLTIHQTKEMIDKIWEKFPGAELVFTVSTSGSTALLNMNRKKDQFSRDSKRKMAIDDAQKTMNSWRTDYKILAEEPVIKYYTSDDKQSLGTTIKLRYSQVAYNHKLIHVKLGNEAYDVNI